MVGKVLPGGTAHPDSPLASKVPKDAQDSDLAKSRVTNLTKVTSQLGRIYQSLSECVVQSDKVLQLDSTMENHPTTRFPLELNIATT